MAKYRYVFETAGSVEAGSEEEAEAAANEDICCYLRDGYSGAIVWIDDPGGEIGETD